MTRIRQPHVLLGLFNAAVAVVACPPLPSFHLWLAIPTLSYPAAATLRLPPSQLTPPPPPLPHPLPCTDIGGLAFAAPYFCSNLVALVGSGSSTSFEAPNIGP